MKVYILEDNSCGLNYQHNYIYNELFKYYKKTSNVAEADIIVLAETCSCTKANIQKTLNNIKDILAKKKPSAKTYLTGCITRSFKDDPFLKSVERWLNENIDYIIPQNQPNLLLNLILKEKSNKDINAFGMLEKIDLNTAQLFISNGCLNDCSFCKLTYQNYPLKSVELNKLKEDIDILDEENYSYILLKGTNICQYGLDIYNDYMLPEVIEYLDKKTNIKSVILIGFSFKDAIKNNFENVLANSSKVSLISGSLETGSNRLLQMIRKGFTSEEIIDFVQNIRKTSDINLVLNIIAGLPTETMQDVEQTLEVLYQLQPALVNICQYINSEFVDSNRFEQLNPFLIQHHAKIYLKALKKARVKIRLQV